ncbi:TPA: hypothetical protein OQW96_004170 [Shigella flexneri]|nr:hypothetical protein [Shigella flexneri]HCS3603107.1 hypothetical protein [Shigella flexneri]
MTELETHLLNALEQLQQDNAMLNERVMQLSQQVQHLSEQTERLSQLYSENWR